jgi:hypothetical protein
VDRRAKEAKANVAAVSPPPREPSPEAIQQFADWLKATFPRGILWAEQGPYSAAQMILGRVSRDRGSPPLDAAPGPWHVGGAHNNRWWISDNNRHINDLVSRREAILICDALNRDHG